MSTRRTSRASRCSKKTSRRANDDARAEAETALPHDASVVISSMAAATRSDVPPSVTSLPGSEEGTLQDQTHRAEGTEPDTAECPRQDGADAGIEEAAAAFNAFLSRTPTRIEQREPGRVLLTSKNPLIEAIRNDKPAREPEVKLDALEEKLGEPLATLLTEILKGPAEAADCLKDPEKARQAIGLWNAEAAYRTGFRNARMLRNPGRPGLPPPCFTRLTRTLVDWARQHGLQVSGMKQLLRKTTTNVAGPRDTHEYRSLDDDERKKFWDAASDDSAQLLYAVSVEAAKNNPRAPKAKVPEDDTVPCKCGWDARTHARNKWIYDECMKATVYSTIIGRLNKKPKTWGRIESVSGIKKVAAAYATRHDLPMPPKRQPGRRSR